MENFIEAFNEGQEAAKQAKIARSEISEVIISLSQQLLEATGGKISVSLDISPLKRMSKSIYPFKAIDGLSGREEEGPFILYANYNFNDHDAHDSVKLAIWEEDSAGYPVTITWGKTQRICNDRESLEKCLMDLLKDPIAAEQISRLIKKNEGTKESEEKDR